MTQQQEMLRKHTRNTRRQLPCGKYLFFTATQDIYGRIRATIKVWDGHTIGVLRIRERQFDGTL